MFRFPIADSGSAATVVRAKRTTHPNLILAICCTSLLIVGMDVTIVNVALPAIQKDLHAHLAGLQWILDSYTPVGWLLVVYALFGVGLGMVNPAITNSAVAGMPLSQAGVAAAIASTSCQVGAALGVAVSGTVVAASHVHGMDFTTATHAIWWVMTACGALVLALGFASNTVWARASAERVAHLLEERR